MMKRHEIQVLLKAGLPQAEVARIAGVSERTVRSVQGEPTVTEVQPQRGELSATQTLFLDLSRIPAQMPVQSEELVDRLPVVRRWPSPSSYGPKTMSAGEVNVILLSWKVCGSRLPSSVVN